MVNEHNYWELFYHVFFTFLTLLFVDECWIADLLEHNTDSFIQCFKRFINFVTLTIRVYAINCSDVQSVQISGTTCKTTDVHRTTRCSRCDDFERQDFCRLRRVTIYRRLHVTVALHSATKHFYQRTEGPAGHCCRQQLFVCEWWRQWGHLASESSW